ncbi:MAG: hypothetical protein AB1589_04800 [Cyanobacteriota bacterium]
MRELQAQGRISAPAKIQNPIPTIEMREPTADTSLSDAVALLNHYGFELKGYTAKELVHLWQKNYPVNWVRMAVIEALYQGRYKAVSVEQILAVWARRGQPMYRFNHEFERLISRKLPQKLVAPLYQRSPDVNLEPNLPIVAPSFPDIPDQRVKFEVMPQESPSTYIPETPRAKTTPTEAETPLESDEQQPETLTDAGSPNHEADWSRGENNRQPIHQFTPPPDRSNFYLKLKAVAEQQEEISSNGVPPIIDEETPSPPPSSKNNS